MDMRSRAVSIFEATIMKRCRRDVLAIAKHLAIGVASVRIVGRASLELDLDHKVLIRRVTHLATCTNAQTPSSTSRAAKSLPVHATPGSSSAMKRLAAQYQQPSADAHKVCQSAGEIRQCRGLQNTGNRR